ncbi:MAG TPA: PilZ domain-containing protein [Myxococcota bacterium]|nr:PilZ domain-containing protein [Myxococcota bacterium]
MQRRFIPELDRREGRRLKEHIPCAVLVNGSRYPGVVRNLSAEGLFIETQAALPLGAAAVVAFRTSAGVQFVLEACVPNRQNVPHSLRRLATDGVGLRLLEPPPAYRRWVEDGGTPES